MAKSENRPPDILFKPPQDSLIVTEQPSGLLGWHDDSCWGVSVPPPGGPWEEVVHGPDADGFYRVEFHPIAPRSVDERNQRVADYISDHGDNPAAVTVRAIAQSTGIPPATVGRLAVWKAFVAQRKAETVGEIRTRPLTEAMLACIADKATETDVLETLIAAQRHDGADDFYPPAQGETE
jgi:hypothetical protein